MSSYIDLPFLKNKATVRARVPHPEMFKVNAEVVVEDALQQLLITVERTVVSSRSTEIKLPATWWDALKEERAPDWFKKRWPVRYKVYDLQAYFPHFTYLPPEDTKGAWVMAVYKGYDDNLGC